MNPANIFTAGLICEELQFLPSLVVLKELLGWQNRKKYIKEREEKKLENTLSQTKAILSTVTAPPTSTELLGEDEQSQYKQLPSILHPKAGAGMWVWPGESCLPHPGGIGNEQINCSELTDPFFLPQNSLPAVATLSPGWACPGSLVGCVGQKEGWRGKPQPGFGAGEHSQPSSSSALQADHWTHH